MSTYILRIDEDPVAGEGPKQYVAWSDNVEAPTVWGDQAEVAEALREWFPNGEDSGAQERFDRADRHGTSALYRNGLGHWGDEWIYKQAGIVNRPTLRAMLERYERDGEDANVLDLLEPLGRD